MRRGRAVATPHLPKRARSPPPVPFPSRKDADRGLSKLRGLHGGKTKARCEDRNVGAMPPCSPKIQGGRTSPLPVVGRGRGRGPNVSYTNLIFICPYPASHQGGMRNRLLYGSWVACLKHLALPHRLLPVMRWLRLCLRRAATYFFQQQKKVGKKCRSQTPRGLHSANRFCNRTTCVGLPSGLSNERGLRDGLARCA